MRLPGFTAEQSLGRGRQVPYGVTTETFSTAGSADPVVPQWVSCCGVDDAVCCCGPGERCIYGYGLKKRSSFFEPPEYGWWCDCIPAVNNLPQ